MRMHITKLVILLTIIMVLFSCYQRSEISTNIPFHLEHNRMLIETEIQSKDGGWNKVRTWVDCGNPDFIISTKLAEILGYDMTQIKDTLTSGSFEISPPSGLKIGNMILDLEGVNCYVVLQPHWLFTTMHIDANLPSTILKKYRVVFDYPNKIITLADEPDIIPVGLPVNVHIHKHTGIIQIDGAINGDSISFALDNGASYSFIEGEVLSKVKEIHPNIPICKGAIGYANMWGWGPNEEKWQVTRVPEIIWGSVSLKDAGTVWIHESFPLAKWYSKKTSKPVNGFIGGNVLKQYRIEIDYANSIVYFQKSKRPQQNDMSLVGITIRQEPDSTYTITGIAEINGEPIVEGVIPGSELFQINKWTVKGQRMGPVIDSLRGKPGEVKKLITIRNGVPHNHNIIVKKMI